MGARPPRPRLARPSRCCCRVCGDWTGVKVRAGQFCVAQHNRSAIEESIVHKIDSRNQTSAFPTLPYPTLPGDDEPALLRGRELPRVGRLGEARRPEDGAGAVHCCNFKEKLLGIGGLERRFGSSSSDDRRTDGRFPLDLSPQHVRTGADFAVEGGVAPLHLAVLGLMGVGHYVADDRLEGAQGLFLGGGGCMRRLARQVCAAAEVHTPTTSKHTSHPIPHHTNKRQKHAPSPPPRAGWRSGRPGSPRAGSPHARARAPWALRRAERRWGRWGLPWGWMAW